MPIEDKRLFAERGHGRRVFPISQEGEAPPEFGIAAPVIRVKRFELAAARILEQNEMGGTLLWAYRASAIGANMDVVINDQRDNAVNFGLGQFIRGIPFSRIFVTNAAQAGAWIDIVYATEPDTSRMEVVNALLAAALVDLVKAANIESIADVAVAAATGQVLAANAARRAAWISNLAANPNAIRMGDAAVGAARGAELAVGSTGIIYTTDSIHVYSAGASNIGVTWTED